MGILAKTFLDPVDVQMQSDGAHWLLLTPFRYDSMVAPETAITVPAGFITDFASVPHWAWSVVGPIGPHARAALVHDFLYSRQVNSRAWADAVLYEAMRVSGVAYWKRKLIYWSVRLCGRSYWDA